MKLQKFRGYHLVVAGRDKLGYTRIGSAASVDGARGAQHVEVGSSSNFVLPYDACAMRAGPFVVSVQTGYIARTG